MAPVRVPTTRLFPLALMFVLALLTFYLERTVRQEEGHPSQRRHDPDYMVINFTTTSYDGDGAVESVMSAAKMIHYPDDDSTELVAPRVVQSKPEQPRVTVRADRGALSREGDEIFLYDNVELVREGKEPAKLTTDFLHVVRDRTLARTDRQVLLQEDSRWLSGRGMEYDWSAGRLTLHGNVRGQFNSRSASQ
jgi:lipopolysaccharide export system protein LptC